MDHDAFHIQTRRQIDELLSFKEKLEPLIEPLSEFLAEWARSKSNLIAINQTEAPADRGRPEIRS